MIARPLCRRGTWRDRGRGSTGLLPISPRRETPRQKPGAARCDPPHSGNARAGRYCGEIGAEACQALWLADGATSHQARADQRRPARKPPGDRARVWAAHHTEPAVRRSGKRNDGKTLSSRCFRGNGGWACGVPRNAGCDDDESATTSPGPCPYRPCRPDGPSKVGNRSEPGPYGLSEGAAVPASTPPDVGDR